MTINLFSNFDHEVRYWNEYSIDQNTIFVKMTKWESINSINHHLSAIIKKLINL